MGDDAISLEHPRETEQLLKALVKFIDSSSAFQ